MDVFSVEIPRAAVPVVRERTVVSSAAGRAAAMQFLASIAEEKKAVVARWKPITDAAYAIHKEAVNRREAELAPYAEADEEVREAVKAFDAKERERVRLEAAARAEAERKRLEEEAMRVAEARAAEAKAREQAAAAARAEAEALRAQAEAANAAGDEDEAAMLEAYAASEDETAKGEEAVAVVERNQALAVIEAAALAPAPVVVPEKPRAKGAGVKYVARVKDIRALARHVGAGGGQTWIDPKTGHAASDFLIVNEKALRDMASRMGGAMRGMFPGVEVEEEQTLRVGGR